MPLTLKLDDDGKVVTSEDGTMPIYVEEVDGKVKETPIDVPGLVGKVNELKGESASRRVANKELSDKLGIFGGDMDVEALTAYKTEADTAIETVKNFNDKDLVEAGKVEEIKKSMKDAHSSDIAEITTNYETKLSEKDKALLGKDGQIYDLMVKSDFSRSKFFVGTDANPPKTLLPPEIAVTYFGKNFKVELDGNESLVVVGYKNDGSQIYSRKRPGELADFDECIAALIEEYPNKDNILRATSSGGGGGDGHQGPRATNELDKLKEQYKEAETAKNGRLMVQLKNKIHAIEAKQRLQTGA